MPKVIVLLGNIAVVDTREFATCVPYNAEFDPRARSTLGIKDPALRRTLQTIALRNATHRLVFWWEEKEDVAVCDSQIKNDLASLIFIAASYMTMKCCVVRQSRTKQALRKRDKPFVDLNHTMSSGLPPFRGTRPYH